MYAVMERSCEKVNNWHVSCDQPTYKPRVLEYKKLDITNT